MTFFKYLELNKISEKELSKEQVWQEAQRQLVADYLDGFIPIARSYEEIDKIIGKINERT